MNEHMQKRVLYAISGAAVFAFLGFTLPYIYFRYFDNTQYYTVVQPIPVDRKYYKPCDNTILTTTRTSAVDTQATFGVDLVLKDKDSNTILKVPNAHFNTEASVKAGTVTLSVVYKLPCALPDGLYYWQATMKYSVRGFEHQYTYVSDTFNVNRFGLDPEVVKIATMSGRPLPTQSPQVYYVPIYPSSTPSQVSAGNSGERPNVTVNNNQAAAKEEKKEDPKPTPENNSIINRILRLLP